MPRNSKDFYILFSKVDTANNKKDIAVVSGYNMIAQQIQQACLTQKGELMADPYFGSDYYSFIFSGKISMFGLQNKLESVIRYAVPTLYDVKVTIKNYTEELLKFDVGFSLSDSIKSQTLICSIEVPLS